MILIQSEHNDAGAAAARGGETSLLYFENPGHPLAGKLKSNN